MALWTSPSSTELGNGPGSGARSGGRTASSACTGGAGSASRACWSNLWRGAGRPTTSPTSAMRGFSAKPWPAKIASLVPGFAAVVYPDWGALFDRWFGDAPGGERPRHRRVPIADQELARAVERVAEAPRFEA